MQDRPAFTSDGICQQELAETSGVSRNCECGRGIAGTSPSATREDVATDARWPLNLATMSKRKVFVRGLIFGLGSGIITTASAWWSSAGFPLGFFG